MGNELIFKHISQLIPYENNPRINTFAVEKVANSIKEFGFKVPIVIDRDNVIVAGHTRYEASKKLGLNEVPCIMADDLTDEQVKAFRLADNKTSEFASWDFEKLELELAALEEMHFSMEEFGFPKKKEPTENPYTDKVEIPKYEPMEELPPKTDELVDLSKVHSLQEEIDKADIPDDVKEFLRYASYRHAVFDYGRIAEFYCHADEEVQDLMEKSALVIIDFDKAIEYGFTNLKTKMDELMEKDRL